MQEGLGGCEGLGLTECAPRARAHARSVPLRLKLYASASVGVEV